MRALKQVLNKWEECTIFSKKQNKNQKKHRKKHQEKQKKTLTLKDKNQSGKNGKKKMN